MSHLRIFVCARLARVHFSREELHKKFFLMIERSGESKLCVMIIRVFITIFMILDEKAKLEEIPCFLS